MRGRGEGQSYEEEDGTGEGGTEEKRKIEDRW